MEMIGYIEMDSKKVLAACDTYLEWVEDQYKKAKEDYIQKLLATKHGFLWNKRYYTSEEAERMWKYGSGDYIYTPSQLQRLKGRIFTDRVHELRILALNSNKVIISNKMSLLFS